MAAHLAQIRTWNPHCNALVAQLPEEQCLALADAADTRVAGAKALGPLHGLPWAFKDLEPASGFPWTRGSTIFRQDVPSFDSVLVERLKKAGVLAIGKTNTPEFGMGSHTYNRVYGTTFNPYDRHRSAGGSSGGAAAAVTTGMLPGADGSDLGGSLRNPASFNNIVGLRPSVGLVPIAPSPLPLFGFAVKGPMARDVRDLAYLLAAMAGADPRDPSCYPSDPQIFAGNLERKWQATRLAWCPDLGGLPLDPQVRAVLQRQRQAFVDLGCIVEEAVPDLSGADEVFLTLRAYRSWILLGPLLAQHRDALKPEALREIEDGARVSAAQLARAQLRHGQILEAMRIFQQTYPYLVCAVSQLPPFDAALPWPASVDGAAMEHYVAWMKSCYWITTTQCPAISVPAGFTPAGLPVGLQIVGPYRDDFPLLQLAAAYEEASGFGRQRPAL